MKILFLGDIVGESGCYAVKKYLPERAKAVANKEVEVLKDKNPLVVLLLVPLVVFVVILLIVKNVPLGRKLERLHQTMLFERNKNHYY